MLDEVFTRWKSSMKFSPVKKRWMTFSSAKKSWMSLRPVEIGIESTYEVTSRCEMLIATPRLKSSVPMYHYTTAPRVIPPAQMA